MPRSSFSSPNHSTGRDVSNSNCITQVRALSYGRRLNGGFGNATIPLEMIVTVRFFGYAAELAGCREARIETDDSTVGGVVDRVRKEFPTLRPLLDGTVRFAVGADYADPATPVRAGDTVSLLPPVGGG